MSQHPENSTIHPTDSRTHSGLNDKQQEAKIVNEDPRLSHKTPGLSGKPSDAQTPLFPWQRPLDPNAVTWDGPNDPANPQNWSNLKRSLITLLCGILTVAVCVVPDRPLISDPY